MFNNSNSQHIYKFENKICLQKTLVIILTIFKMDMDSGSDSTVISEEHQQEEHVVEGRKQEHFNVKFFLI
jgi:hypothetical protein